MKPAEPLPRPLLLAATKLRVQTLAATKLRVQTLVEPLPRLPLRVGPNPSRHCPEGDPISFRLCREEGLVFGTRSIHQTQ